MRSSRAGLIAAGIVALFAIAYLGGVLPLGISLRAAATTLGLYLLLVVLQVLPLSEPARELEVFAGFNEPARRQRRPRRLGRRARSRSFSEETSLDRVLRIAEGSATDFEVHLRPRLAAVCRRRLTDAGHDPGDLEAVERVLGPLGRAVLDPRRSPNYDPRAPGVPVSDVLALLERAERLT